MRLRVVELPLVPDYSRGMLQAYAPLRCELARMEMSARYGVKDQPRVYDPLTGIVIVRVNLNPLDPS